MNYYNEIKNKIIDNEIYQKAKDYSKEKNKVITYFEIGRLLNEAGSKYGKNIIVEYGEKLSIEINKKYNYRTLYRMRKLYEIFSNEKLTPMVSKLTWSHYLQLLSIKDENKIIYYIYISIKNNLTKRELESKIKSKEYERLPIETKNKLLNNVMEKVEDFIKNPIIIRNKNNIDLTKLSEKMLKQLILEDIEYFMKELGNGFCYIDNEYKIKLGDRYNYIDLLLFNYIHNCFVVVELKVTELKSEYIGQIKKYMNYIDVNVKNINQNKTIGIIIVKKNNRYVIEYCGIDYIYFKEFSLR